MIKTDLDHLPKCKQRTLEEIRCLILDEVSGFAKKNHHQYIVWLVLYGSYARGSYVEDSVNGYISDFDILVAVNGCELADDTRLWYAIEDKADKLTRIPLNLIVHTHEEIAQKLVEGYYFFTDICTEGIYLYTSKPDKGLPQPKNLTDKEKLLIAQKHYKQWLESSSKFLEYAGIAIGKSDYKETAFFLHQATKRFYACILLVLSNYRPKTHNIERLRNMAIQHSNPESLLSSIFAGVDRLQRRSFQRLKRAYIDARYSEYYEITEEELNWLMQEVVKLEKLVNIICKNHNQSVPSTPSLVDVDHYHKLVVTCLERITLKMNFAPL